MPNITKPVSKITETIKKIFTYVKRNNPFHLKVERKGFDPREESGRTFLVTIDSNSESAEVKEVKEEKDDLALEIDGNKHCAITSKPLVMHGNRFYFTRSGFVGTMALHQHTLLSGDVYKPSKGKTRLDVSNVDMDKIDMPDKAEIKTDDNGDDYVEFEGDENFQGEIVSLIGSKSHLYEMNKAKRLKKLLTPEGVSRDRMMAYIGSGVAIGFLISKWLAQQ